ncbi:TlpA family protein disulfide reductase [Accumulibacter sp.]|uniref:TlpA family protein disulfide reductase n=1 Tax=Accumulibacter sp. TaxID=2053492 RepID=UPI0035B36667
MRRAVLSPARRLARRVCRMLLLLACALSPAAAAAELREVSARRLSGTAGTPLDSLLAPLAGRPVIINFWASWCEPCRDEMPALQQLGTRWREQRLAVLTVAVADQRARLDSFLTAHAIELPVIDDREQQLSRALGVRLLPTTLVLDRHHRTRLRAEGAIDWHSATVSKRLRAVLEPPARLERPAR